MDDTNSVQILNEPFTFHFRLIPFEMECIHLPDSAPTPSKADQSRWHTDAPIFCFHLILKSVTRPCHWDLEYADCIPCKRDKTPPKRGVLGTTLNLIWLWGSSPPGALGIVESPPSLPLLLVPLWLVRVPKLHEKNCSFV